MLMPIILQVLQLQKNLDFRKKDHLVVREKHKWMITRTGEAKVLNDQEYGSLPTRKW
jgi:hypothetical protein